MSCVSLLDRSIDQNHVARALIKPYEFAKVCKNRINNTRYLVPHGLYIPCTKTRCTVCISCVTRMGTCSTETRDGIDP